MAETGIDDMKYERRKVGPEYNPSLDSWQYLVRSLPTRKYISLNGLSAKTLKRSSDKLQFNCIFFPQMFLEENLNINHPPKAQKGSGCPTCRDSYSARTFLRHCTLCIPLHFSAGILHSFCYCLLLNQTWFIFYPPPPRNCSLSFLLQRFFVLHSKIGSVITQVVQCIKNHDL